MCAWVEGPRTRRHYEMKLGIWTPLPHTVRVDPLMAQAIGDLRITGSGGATDKSFRIAIDVVRRAEELGFVSTLIAERHLGPDLEAWILASAMIAETRNIELLVAVHPGIFSPQVTAKMGATLDRISGGRFAVNIVNGWFQKEFDVFGNNTWLDQSEERYVRMGEFMAIVHGLWTQDEYTLDGQFYKCVDGTLPIRPLQTPSPPIYAASRAASGKEAIARYCDYWFVAYEGGLKEAEENSIRIKDGIKDMNERAAEFGRTMSYGMSAHVICADTYNEAEERANALEEYGETDPIAAVAAKALGVGLVGTPAQIIERLNYYSDIGVDMPMIHFYPMMSELEKFAAKILPKLKLS